MKKLRHIFAFIFILFSLCISPSFSGSVGKAKNHFSQVVDNEKLQFNVLNQHYKSSGERWYEEDDCFSKGFKTQLSKIETGYLTERTTSTI